MFFRDKFLSNSRPRLRAKFQCRQADTVERFLNAYCSFEATESTSKSRMITQVTNMSFVYRYSNF